MKPEDTRTVKELIASLGSGPRPKYVHFWGHKPRPDGQVSSACFSQWFNAGFEDKGVHYATAEHYMMAKKARLFDDAVQFEKILHAKNPGAAKAFGRNVLNFDNAIWEAHRFNIVARGNELKFGQNAELKSFLLGTGKRILVEASPPDKIWGIGLDKTHEHASIPANWRGLNLLGFALMEARSRLAG